MSRHLVIVPALNESQSIAGTVADLRTHVPEFDIVVIDDGSTDDTAARARAAGADVVSLPFNLGIGGAVQTGYRYALARGYTTAIQVDGDGQHDAAHIRSLLEHLVAHPDLDMVVGSRFMAAGEGFQSSRLRRVGIRVFARILSLFIGHEVTDPTSGFRMTGPRGIALFARDYPHDYPEVEAVLMMHAHELRSAEIPVVMRARQGGTSSITSIGSFYYMFKVTLALLVGFLRAKPVRPLGRVQGEASA
ncbi:MAG: glycosyltransferase family 2 protein [Solirubrobacteraceae bacterium]|nr:glycosyltransferase family 2 protein [Solirubrobacteraceae bacterium]